MTTAKKSEFSWDEVYQRRRVLADEIRKKIDLSFDLTGEIEEPFHAYEMTDQLLADKPMWMVPFYVIAQRMKEATDGHHVIDHAWWLIAADRGAEPWGFVTEPYIDPERAAQMAKRLSRQHARWGISVETWPQEMSPWLPGSTVPIVTTASPGWLRDFLRFGVTAALKSI